MAESGTAILVVVLTILGVVIFNLGLFMMVKSGARKKDTETFKTLLRITKNPFKETEKDLDDLSEIIRKVNQNKNTETETD